MHRNHHLRCLLSEAGWSGEAFARRINEIAAESGVSLRLDRRVVSTWLAGRRPRPPIPALAAEAFTRTLGRVVSVADTDLSATTHAGVSAPEAWGETVRVLRELADESRRNILTNGVYSLALLAVPRWSEAVALGDRHAAENPPSGQLTQDHVDAALDMARLFADADGIFGGGHSRRALSLYLANDIAPKLGWAASSALRTRMQRAALLLAYRCGFMCFDDRAYGLAQRYYRIALELAANVGDSAAYAVVLRAMSVQARVLGHHGDAVQLAQSAVSTAHKPPVLRQAFLFGQLAVAAAGAQDKATALSALSTAERSVDRATSPGTANSSSATGPVFGDYHGAALAHQQAAVQALLGDRKGAISSLQASLRGRPPTERRSRAIITARLAELHLSTGHLDQAIATWHTFLDDYPYLRSGRATAALHTLRSHLVAHGQYSGAQRLLVRAASV